MSGDLGKETVVTNHQTHFADARVEHRIFLAGRDASFDLAARQADLSIFANDAAIRADQHRHVVDQVALALDQSDDQVQAVFLGERREIFRGRSRDRLRGLGIREARAADRERLRQNDQVGLFPRRLLDERRKQPAILGGAFLARGPEMDGCQAHLAGWRRARLAQRNLTPLHLGARGPAEIQLDDRLRRPFRRAIGICDLGPTGRAGVAIARIFRLRHGRLSRGVAARPRLVVDHRPARAITPENPRQRAAPGDGRVHQTAHRPKLIVVSALDGKCFHPMPIQSVAFVRANDQTAAG